MSQQQQQQQQAIASSSSAPCTCRGEKGPCNVLRRHSSSKHLVMTNNDIAFKRRSSTGRVLRAGLVHDRPLFAPDHDHTWLGAPVAMHPLCISISLRGGKAQRTKRKQDEAGAPHGACGGRFEPTVHHVGVTDVDCQCKLA
jgi:hypothetical protein